MKKNYSFTIIAKDTDGQYRRFNETNPARGYRKSWFGSESAARKHLSAWITICQAHEYTEIQYQLYHRESDNAYRMIEAMYV